MFFSHQLLARKAPLGQIWMAATMHAKMNRRKLNKLNIIKICEEILNPQVPMALRLSGILMGGVVIVYERKVKLLYDDVTRLLVEINEAWKVKAAPDPTMLPKGKSQARKEAVTLPQLQETDLEDVEQSLNCSDMQLDNVDDTFVHENPGEEEPPHGLHQADVDNITIFERFDSSQINTGMYDRFERFDIDEELETQLNFNSGDQTHMPTTLIPSPPPQDEPHRADEVHDHYPEKQVNQISDESKQARQGRQRQGPLKRKTRRPAAPLMDFEQTMIPGHTYQSWLRDTSDISGRGKKKKATTNILSAKKIAKLMELPPLAYVDLLTKGTGEIHYPAPLLELWTKNTLTSCDSSSARTSPPQPPEPSMSSPPVGGQYHDADISPFEDIHSGVGSQSGGVSIEKDRTNFVDNIDNPAEEIRANLMNIKAFRADEVNSMVTPRKSDDVRSIPSSASGHGNSETNSGRFNQKRPFSSSRISSSDLKPVAEETDPDFSLLPRLSENGRTTHPETLVETGPTQTQPPIPNPPANKISDSIRMQMKSHFDTPGAPKVESLNNLAAGLTRKAAAMLFYQTCVLATDGSLRVEQKEPYGDIFISKGAKDVTRSNC